jgi:N-acetylmuramoyl-L-alanine amidase
MALRIEGEYYGPDSKNNEPDHIVIHSLGVIPERPGEYGALNIDAYHTAPEPRGNGWSAIGYHFVIKTNGVVERGRRPDTNGAHCYGLNGRSIGICVVCEDFNADATIAQYFAARELVQSLMEEYGIPITRVIGHREWDTPERRKKRGLGPKTCPGKTVDVEEMRSWLNNKTPAP